MKFNYEEAKTINDVTHFIETFERILTQIKKEFTKNISKQTVDSKMIDGMNDLKSNSFRKCLISKKIRN